MKRKKKKRIGKVQGYALLYGRSSRAIRIVNGEMVGSTETVRIVNGGKKRSTHGQKPRIVTNTNGTGKPAQQQKKYKMSDEAKKKLDRLQDPLEMMSRNARTQKYEAAKSREDYEYGLSDW